MADPSESSVLERRRREAAEARLRLNEEEKRKAKELKIAKVREGLQAASRKKGFMTPDRKKKLRTLLRIEAAKRVRIEQEKQAAERRQRIAERAGQKKSIDGANEATLQSICKEYHERISKLEGIKYDLECEVRQKDSVVNELSIHVNGLRGKFVKPALKKVYKYDYELKLEKMAKVAAKAEMNFRHNLKRVQSIKYKMSDDEKEERPEWALGKGKDQKTENQAEEVEVED